MEEQIINRVANSKLLTIDLEEFYPEGKREQIDISQWLTEGIFLKEKDFREYIKNHNWSMYNESYVAIHCATDAIIPAWAFMLITSEISPFAKKVVIGDLNLLESILFSEVIENLNIDQYLDKSVIIKGCSNKPIPSTAYSLLVQKLQHIAKSIMYGEACSSVPIYKS